MPIKLPIPVENVGNTAELKKPDTDVILNVAEQAEKGSVFAGMFQLLNGCVTHIGKQKAEPEMIRRMPYVSAEVCMCEAFKLYKIPTKLEGMYRCPRNGCNEPIICEENLRGGYDTRDDFNDFEIVYYTGKEYSGSNFHLSLAPDERAQYVDAKGENETEVTSHIYRVPVMEDMIEMEMEGRSSYASFQKGLYYRCLNGGAVANVGESSWSMEKVKHRYGEDVVRFPDIRTFNRVTLGLRTYGLQPYSIKRCKTCGKEWRQAVDFASFFVSALRSWSSETGAR